MTTPTPRTDVCLITCQVCGSEGATSNEASINKELFRLRRDLAAAQEARQAAEEELSALKADIERHIAIVSECVQRAQRAEALAESYKADAERWRLARRLLKQHIIGALWDIAAKGMPAITEENADAAIDAAREPK